MAIRNASVVDLGPGGIDIVIGCHHRVAAILEKRVLRNTQVTYNRFRLTLMHDNRIVIEKEFLPLENKEE